MTSLPLLVHDVGSFDYDDPHTQYSIASQTLVDATIDVLADCRCFETPHGWILALEPVSLRTFLWRPEDDERITLPSMEKNLTLDCKCILSDKPSSGSCVVMVLDLYDLQYWTCPIGGSKWERHGYTLTIYDSKNQRMEFHMARGQGIASVGGKVYYMLAGHELGVVEFDPVNGEPNLTFIEVDMVDIPDTLPMWYTYLVESCEELFLVVIFFDGENVHKIAELAVYKMDFSMSAWCKVDKIGDDRVFLLGGHHAGISSFGASCAASACGLTGNSIYFLNHVSESYLHIFNLDKGTEEVQRPFEDFVYPLRPPFWLLPTDSRRDRSQKSQPSFPFLEKIILFIRETFVSFK